MALLCEGGGQRGNFTAGVLDEFQYANFNPFQLYLGTSAGAQNLSASVYGQAGYARRVIARDITNKLFFNPLRFVCGGHLIDLDWLTSITSEELPLAMNQAEKLFASGRKFYMCACRSDDDSPRYFQPDSSYWLKIINVSSTIPGFCRAGMQLEENSYLDGGITDAIPVREAARRGAETIVVIRTVPAQMTYTPDGIKRMERWVQVNPWLKLLQEHGKSYREIQQFIQHPPGNLRIIEIYPLHPLASSALGSRPGALHQDYHLGRRCGHYFLATLGSWLDSHDALPGVQMITPPAPVANEPALCR